MRKCNLAHLRALRNGNGGKSPTTACALRGPSRGWGIAGRVALEARAPGLAPTVVFHREVESTRFSTKPPGRTTGPGAALNAARHRVLGPLGRGVTADRRPGPSPAHSPHAVGHAARQSAAHGHADATRTVWGSKTKRSEAVQSRLNGNPHSKRWDLGPAEVPRSIIGRVRRSVAKRRAASVRRAAL